MTKHIHIYLAPTKTKDANLSSLIAQNVVRLKEQYKKGSKEAKEQLDRILGKGWESRDASFPQYATFKGERYSKTGKTGKNFKTGEETAEYQLESYVLGKTKIDERVWRTASGTVTQDNAGTFPPNSTAYFEWGSTIYTVKVQGPDPDSKGHTLIKKGNSLQSVPTHQLSKTKAKDSSSISEIEKQIAAQERLIEAVEKKGDGSSGGIGQLKTRLKFLKEELDKAKVKTGDAAPIEYKGYIITEESGNVNRAYPSTFRAKPKGNKSPYSMLSPSDTLADMKAKIDHRTKDSTFVGSESAWSKKVKDEYPAATFRPRPIGKISAKVGDKEVGYYNKDKGSGTIVDRVKDASAAENKTAKLKAAEAMDMTAKTDHGKRNAAETYLGNVARSEHYDQDTREAAKKAATYLRTLFGVKQELKTRLDKHLASVEKGGGAP